MKIKNYCIAAVDNVAGVREEIASIAESDVKYVDGKGLIIATFSNAALVYELREYFRENNRSFLLFELGDDNFGAHFTKKHIYNHLFAEIDNQNTPLDSTKQHLMNDLLNSSGGSISGVTASTKTSTIVKSKKTDTIELTSEEVKFKIDQLLDKGISNLTIKEKKDLAGLSKKISKK